MLTDGATRIRLSRAEREATFMRVTAGMGLLALAIALVENEGKGPEGLVIPLVVAPAVVLVVHAFVVRIPSVVLFPLIVVGPTIVFFFGYAEGSMFFTALGALLATYSVDDRRLASVLCAGMALLPIIAGLTSADETGWPFWFLGVMLGWLFGLMARLNKDLVVQLEQQSSLITERAVDEERRRMARDVHDLVGHSLSAVLLHVTGARRAVRRHPENAEAALESAEQIGRASLAEIRRSMGMLRAANGSDREPSPTAHDIPKLVDERRSAGQDVALSTSGELERVGSAIGLTAYRLVQESLSNVAKHAPGAQSDVEVNIDQHECRIIVENPLATSRPLGAVGYGLIGMRERVQAVGGQLSVGPAGPVWRVDATLPLAESVASS